jgi:hypothetical protein
MNARLQMKLLKPEVPAPVAIRHQPLTLSPIRWGERDTALAQMVCRHIVDATPPIEIPANPITHARVRAYLRSHHIEHY